MAYPLPDAGWNGDYQYFLVAIPAGDPVFARVAKGHYGELGRVSNHGEEGVVHPGSDDTAQAWLNAINETWRLIEMGWPDDVYAAIDEVETLLRALQTANDYAGGCCKVQGDIAQEFDSGLSEETDPVPPAVTSTYPAATDWPTAYTEYLCPALKTLWQRQDTELLDPIGEIIDLGFLSLNAIVSIYVGLTGIGGALLLAGLSVSTFMSILSALKDLGSSVALGDYSGLDNYADDFVCAIRAADGADAKSQAAHDFIDGLALNTITSRILKLHWTPSFLDRVYHGEDLNGEPIELADNTGGCPDCTEPPAGTGFAVDSGTDVFGSLSYPAASPPETPQNQLYENVVYRMTGKLSGGRNNRIQWQLDPDKETAAPGDSLQVTLTVVGGEIDTSYGSFYDAGSVKTWDTFDGDFVLEGGSQLFNVAGTSSAFEVEVEVAVL